MYRVDVIGSGVHLRSDDPELGEVRISSTEMLRLSPRTGALTPEGLAQWLREKLRAEGKAVVTEEKIEDPA